MFCINCGANNSEVAVYCLKCGRLLQAEEETRLSRRDPQDHFDEGDNEVVIFSATPTLLFVYLGYAAAVLVALLLAAIFSLLFPSVAPWLVVALGLSLLLIPAYYHVRQKLVRYTLTDTVFQLDRGFISRETKNLPLRRVQDVTVSTSIMQRILGFGDIEIENAGDDGGEKVVLKNINSPRKYADSILKQIRHLDR